MKPRLRALLGVVLLTAGHAYGADLLTTAGNAVAGGDYAAALADLNKLRGPQADQAEARFLRGTALAGDGKLDEAAAVLRKLIADYPRLPEPYNNLAAIYAREGRLADAKTVLERGLHTDARYAALYQNLSDIYVQMARASYAKALRIQSANPPPALQVLTALQSAPEAAAPIIVASAQPLAEPSPAATANVVPATKQASAPAAASDTPPAAGPIPVPAAASTPTPAPAPVAKPIPAPAPKPTPAPVPKQALVPEPKPMPAPAPKPVPAPAPKPAPEPAPAPEPKQALVPAPASEPASVPVTAPTAAPAPVPAPTPAPAPVPAAPVVVAGTAPAAAKTPGGAAPESEQLAVVDALNGWAKAWSQRDVAAYLAHYAADYAPPGTSRGAWEEERRLHLTRPAWIKVSLTDIGVRFTTPAQATVTLTQHYSAAGYKDVTVKRLTLVLRDGNWMITSEQSLKVMH